MDDYVTKPGKAGELRDILARLINGATPMAHAKPAEVPQDYPVLGPEPQGTAPISAEKLALVLDPDGNKVEQLEPMPWDESHTSK